MTIKCPLFLLLLLAAAIHAPGSSPDQPVRPAVVAHPVPEEFASRRFEATVNGQRVPVFHATLNLHFASFDFTGTAEVEVRFTGTNKAAAADYWRGQAMVRPLSRGIVPVTRDKVCTFAIKAPGQFSVERPGVKDFRDEALFIFANAPDAIPPPVAGPNSIVLPPGIHRQDIDLKSGQTLYLSPGAVLFGSIDVWDAEDVRIAGRGAVVHYGPQALGFDTGYKHQRAWHPLTTHQAKRLSVSGVTFVNRSRTWSIQMWNTTEARFENIKVIAASDTNINQDGMDWYGGGHTVVRDSFLRTADDCFALLNASSLPFPHSTGSSTGEVVDITIERCVLWPSLANIFRLGWIGQSISTRDITLRDSDIIHFPGGYWLAPNALIHAASVSTPGTAHHRNYLLENLRFEEPIPLFGINYPDTATLTNFTLRNISIPGPVVPSLFESCTVDGITFDNVSLDGKVLRGEADFPARCVNAKLEHLRFQ